jgi:hypothetical protein
MCLSSRGRTQYADFSTRADRESPVAASIPLPAHTLADLRPCPRDLCSLPPVLFCILIYYLVLRFKRQAKPVPCSGVIDLAERAPHKLRSSTECQVPDILLPALPETARIVAYCRHVGSGGGNRGIAKAVPGDAFARRRRQSNAPARRKAGQTTLFAWPAASFAGGVCCHERPKELMMAHLTPNGTIWVNASRTQA